jgi:hypothetical protein
MHRALGHLCFDNGYRKYRVRGRYPNGRNFFRLRALLGVAPGPQGYAASLEIVAALTLHKIALRNHIRNNLEVSGKSPWPGGTPRRATTSCC